MDIVKCPVETKICGLCNRRLPNNEDNFIKYKHGTWCRMCTNAYARTWHTKHKNIENEKQKEYYYRNREAIKQQHKEYYQRKKQLKQEQNDKERGIDAEQRT